MQRDDFGERGERNWQVAVAEAGAEPATAAQRGGAGRDAVAAGPAID
jgi:hypothetical protein